MLIPSYLPVHDKSQLDTPSQHLSIIFNFIFYSSLKVREASSFVVTKLLLLFRPILIMSTVRNAKVGKCASKKQADYTLESCYSTLTCPICQDWFKSAVLCDCGHSFCRECITMWRQTKSTCPVCRATITTAPMDNKNIDAICLSVQNLMGPEIAKQLLIDEQVIKDTIKQAKRKKRKTRFKLFVSILRMVP